MKSSGNRLRPTTNGSASSAVHVSPACASPAMIGSSRCIPMSTTTRTARMACAASIPISYAVFCLKKKTANEKNLKVFDHKTGTDLDSEFRVQHTTHNSPHSD